jgi:hypothetical protein
MENDFTKYVWDRLLSSDYHLDISSPEIVVAGNPVKPSVTFEYPTNGYVDTYVRIGISPGTWLHGSNTVIRPPAHASTTENSAGMQWNANGLFQYSAGWTDQGLSFGADYEKAIASPPSVPSPSYVPNPPNAISVFLHCPANLSLFDSQGNHLGYNLTTGVIDQQIPDSLCLFSEDIQTIRILNPSGDYTLLVVGTGEGFFGLEVQWQNQTGVITTIWNSTGTISKDDVTSYTISAATVPQVTLIPEFPQSFLLLLLVMTLLLVGIVYRRKHPFDSHTRRPES